LKINSYDTIIGFVLSLELLLGLTFNLTHILLGFTMNVWYFSGQMCSHCYIEQWLRERRA